MGWLIKNERQRGQGVSLVAGRALQQQCSGLPHRLVGWMVLRALSCLCTLPMEPTHPAGRCSAEPHGLLWRAFFPSALKLSCLHAQLTIRRAGCFSGNARLWQGAASRCPGLCATRGLLKVLLCLFLSDDDNEQPGGDADSWHH